VQVSPSAGPIQPQGRRLRICLLSLYLVQPLGLRLISSALRARGHQTSLVFFKEGRQGRFVAVTPREEEMLISLLRRLKPDLVGMSVGTSFVADLAYHLSRVIRAELGAPVLLGGTHPSVCPEECLEHADFVCRGEGEEAAAELADALAAGGPVHNIPNIWARVDGRVWRNEVRAPMADLDRTPPVTYGDPDSYFIEENHLQVCDPALRHNIYHTTVSRMSCPFRCSFCTSDYLQRELYAGHRRHARYRSVSSIIEEINRGRERNPNVELVWFWDEIFGAGAPRGWLEEFCERFPREVGLPFETFLHVSFVTDERIRGLRQAGLRLAWVGIESGSEQVRRQVLTRTETNRRVLAAARILHRHRVAVGYEFILDLPWLEEENCRGSFGILMRLPRPFTVHLHSLTYLPGTSVTRRALAAGVIKPGQVARADQPLVDRFESHFWQSGLNISSRRTAYWHSLIYLASQPFIPRPVLWALFVGRPLLQHHPHPMVLAARLLRIREGGAEETPAAALASVYPRLAGFLGRHPRLRDRLRRLGVSLQRLAAPG